jgi:hypothetical protein
MVRRHFDTRRAPTIRHPFPLVEPYRALLLIANPRECFVERRLICLDELPGGAGQSVGRTIYLCG